MYSYISRKQNEKNSEILEKEVRASELALDGLDPLADIGGKAINWKREWRMALDKVEHTKKIYCRLVLTNDIEQEWCPDGVHV